MPSKTLGAGCSYTHVSTNFFLVFCAVAIALVGTTLVFKSTISIDIDDKVKSRRRRVHTEDIDLVSLTIKGDFYVLFNNSAITSWIRHIKNIRSITFIGPPDDYGLFSNNMKIHYPNLMEGKSSNITIQWVNQTHWVTKYMDKYGKAMPCPYWKVCQQLFKLHVFDLRTDLGLDMLDNILIVDSDTVWSRDITFVNGTNGKVTYFESGGGSSSCNGMDPVNFTEAITMGPPTKNTTTPTLTPYKSCIRPEYPNATGHRHIVHHMLFQYDVMSDLHNTVTQAWNTSSLWDASNKCFGFSDFCAGRVAEYELYFSFVSENYPQRVNLERLTDRVDYMGGSAICDEKEMECCREQGVLLKGCHDHRMSEWKKNPAQVGDMCRCQKD